ncbi:MAG: multiubiquitin domain-containing protein [Cytophagales bacterium]
MTKSKKSLTTTAQGVEVVDVENYASQNRKPPKGMKYKVRIGNEKYTFDQECVTGSEILIKAGYTPIECYTLYQKLRGCNFEKISSTEKVDLSKPGIERFVVKEPEVFHYSVDGEPETTDLSELTPVKILELAGIKPVSDYYLVQVLEDQSQVSYKDKPNDPIQMKCPGLKFISVYRSTTPVA